MRRGYSSFGRFVSSRQRLRGEYPTVASARYMIPSRCALEVAWTTAIFDERKAKRVFSRMRDRMVKLLGERADVVHGSGNEEILRREQARLYGTEFVIADRVPCGKSTGCWVAGQNTIYFKRSVFAHRPGEYGPLDPFRQLSHGALVHEIAHAATMVPVKVTRYFGFPEEGQTSGVLVDKYHVHRRQPHGSRFAQRLAQAVRAWCETEGKPVCDFYCGRHG